MGQQALWVKLEHVHNTNLKIRNTNVQWIFRKLTLNLDKNCVKDLKQNIFIIETEKKNRKNTPDINFNYS